MSHAARGAASEWPPPSGRRLAVASAGRADLAAVRAHVAAALADADPAVRDGLVLAVDELCANVVLHAYAAPGGPLTVDVAANDATDDTGAAAVCYRITVVDAGPPFDPTSVAEPDVSLPLDARPVGGLGLSLVRRTTDAFHWARVDGHNVVTLEKLDPRAPSSRSAIP